MPLSRHLWSASLLLLAISCREPAGPGFPGTLAGRFVLVRVDGYAPGTVCTFVTDPNQGEMITAGTLTFDPDRRVVREQQQRIDGFSCTGSLVGDSITVDQERAFERRGDTVFIERPFPAGGTYRDSALVRGDTLSLFTKVVGDVRGGCLSLADYCALVPLRYERQ